MRNAPHSQYPPEIYPLRQVAGWTWHGPGQHPAGGKLRKPFRI